QLGQLGAAKRDLQIALKIAPGLPEAHWQLHVLRLVEMRPQDALRDIGYIIDAKTPINDKIMFPSHIPPDSTRYEEEEATNANSTSKEYQGYSIALPSQESTMPMFNQNDADNTVQERDITEGTIALTSFNRIVEAHRAQGHIYSSLNESALAIDSYTCLIKLRPTDAKAFLKRAAEYEKVKVILMKA
ncbi:unnamed protein product, partial [Protopolystoma xenopodis]